MNWIHLLTLRKHIDLYDLYLELVFIKNVPQGYNNVIKFFAFRNP